MIIVRSPLRISLGGGGTDLPSYASKYDGFVLAAAINKYVYVTVNESFRPQIDLKYSKLEEVDTVDQVQHPVIREALRLTGITGSIDIANLADIPHSTGLGSSGSFTTALLHALNIYKHRFTTVEALAEQAFKIEHDILGQNCGRQDQYIAAVGGITCFNFFSSGKIVHSRLAITDDTRLRLEEGLMLFFTGYSRSASDILAHQVAKADDEAMLENLHKTKAIGRECRNALLEGDLHEFGRLMDAHWRYKRERSPGMSNDSINELYALALRNGAVGGKLVGAGGGGFLLFYTENRRQLRNAMTDAGLREVRFHFDNEGTSCIARTT